MEKRRSAQIGHRIVPRRDTYRFIEEEDGRVFQQQSRDCHSLLLASGYHKTAFPDLCLILLWETLNCLIDLSPLRSGNNLFIGGVQSAVPDVVHDIGMEQRSILWHDTNRLSKGFQLHILDVLAIDQDFTALRVVEAEEQSENRRFTTSRGSDDGDFFTGRDGKAEILEDRSVRVVPKVDVFKLDLASLQLERLG